MSTQQIKNMSIPVSKVGKMMIKKSPSVTTVLPSKSNIMLNDFYRYGFTGVKLM